MIQEFEKEALTLDSQDPLRSYRDRFSLPDKIYLCHNSLGLPPKETGTAMQKQIEKWSNLGVEAWFQGKKNWYEFFDHELREKLAIILGANKNEVVVMNSLTVNLHLLFASFYKPTKNRYKILIDAPTFPSDLYAIKSQIEFHGLDPNECLIIAAPRHGEHTLRQDDIVQIIEENGDSIAIVFFSSVNYLTGQLLDMEAITKISHTKGCVVGFDIAHATGNIPLSLHNWNVDFAVGCSYKYLCSGPGGPGIAYVHECHHDKNLPRLAGWWGNEPETRFEMTENFVPIKGASGWQVSTPSILAMTPLLVSLDLYVEAGIENLRKKSVLQTNFLIKMLNHINKDLFEVITPKNMSERGCQTSLLFFNEAEKYQKELEKNGVICDFRNPNIIRATPSPLYTSFNEIFHFTLVLENV